MKKVFIFVLLVVSYLFFATGIHADYGCSDQYGGCAPSLTISVNKQVGVPGGTNTDPTLANFVDNLSSADPRFSPEQLVFFKVTVKNTSNTTLSNVTVKDVVPSFIEPVSGPGSWDGSNRVITFSAGDFTPGEEKVYFFKMQVDPIGSLPSDKGLFCIVNQAQAFNDRVSGSDSSQLCIEKQVLGAATVPASGPEFGLLLLGLNLAGLGVGFTLKRKAK